MGKKMTTLPANWLPNKLRETSEEKYMIEINVDGVKFAANKLQIGEQEAMDIIYNYLKFLKKKKHEPYPRKGQIGNE